MFLQGEMTVSEAGAGRLFCGHRLVQQSLDLSCCFLRFGICCKPVKPTMKISHYIKVAFYR
jgi:hypothetical protein